METGKKLNVPKDGRGVIGAGIGEADSEDRGFPPNGFIQVKI
jgi:hypothetical protein